MTDTNSSSPDFQTSRWAIDDLTFAATQLAQEFPTIAKDTVFAAVNSAAPFIPPAEGRVRLMRRARAFLRPS